MYRSSISFEYISRVFLRWVVPLAARTNGRSGSAAMIISLNTRENAGASALASSTCFLHSDCVSL